MNVGTLEVQSLKTSIHFLTSGTGMAEPSSNEAPMLGFSCSQWSSMAPDGPPSKGGVNGFGYDLHGYWLRVRKHLVARLWVDQNKEGFPRFV